MNPTDYINYVERGEDPLRLAQDALLRGLEAGDHRKSLRNCHTHGLDSIVLYDGEDGMIRFFVAWAHCNQLGNLYDESGHFTIGVHNHRYKLAKIPLDNAIINVTTFPADQLDVWDRPTPGTEPHQLLYEYGFRSELKEGEKMGVDLYGARRMALMRPQLVTPGRSVVMKPEDLHTVMVDPTVTTSWMVIEGPQVDIDPKIYSPRVDLCLVKDPTLYQPMDDNQSKRAILGVLQRMAKAA